MMMDAAIRVPCASTRTVPQSGPLRCGVAAGAVVLLLALAGCAGTPGPSAGESEPTEQTQSESADKAQSSQRQPLEAEGVVEHQVDNRAVALLWDEAEQARRNGNLEAAVASLERAVRVAPDDPVLWSRLAELRFRQQEFAVAENLAAKSNALAGDRQLLRFRNWLIIAEARKQRGDQEGAKQARNEARRLRGGGSSGQ